MKRAVMVAVAGAVAATAVATSASARGPHRMTSVDYTKGGKPVVHDNGVPDGRLCKIFWKQVYDPWIEDFKVVKAKRCI